MPKLKSLDKAMITAELAGEENEIKRTNTPPEWRPRIELDATGGYVVATPRQDGNMPDATELLKEFNLDPLEWEVLTVRTGKWQRFDGEWLETRRINIKPASVSGKDIDYDALLSEVIKYKPRVVKPGVGPLCAIYAIGDTQYGKDAGGGTEATVRRVLGAINEAVTRHTELIKLGRPIGTIVLPQLGDCIEGSTSQNGKVLGRSDLGVSQQTRIGRRVLMAWIKAFAPLCDELIIPVVPGNHDETHRMLMTDPIDSWQIEIVSAVQDACAENPALNHVKFYYPTPDNSTLAIDLGGTVVGFAHGHQSRDMAKWWQGQATGRTPVGSAEVLLTGHFHHFKANQVGPRLWVQVPAMDGGSAWFRDKTGLESPTGIVSLVVGGGYDPRRDLAVLAGENRLN